MFKLNKFCCTIYIYLLCNSKYFYIMKKNIIIPQRNYSFREKFIVYLLGKSIQVHAQVKLKRKPWGLKTEQLVNYPPNSLGKVLGDFLTKEKLQPIDKLERHDVFHILLDYETDLKDEAGLYFFLFGNGKKSLFAVGTVLFSAVMFPEHWQFLYKQYKRGQQAYPIISLKFQELLFDNYEDLKKVVFREPIENINLLNKLVSGRQRA